MRLHAKSCPTAAVFYQLGYRVVNCNLSFFGATDRTRNFGSMTAIGSFGAAIMLLTGLPTAHADELADLRANQELLQRRIDQLAQGVSEGPGAPPSSGPG